MYDVSFKQAGTKTKWDVPPPKEERRGREGEAKPEEPVRTPG